MPELVCSKGEAEQEDNCFDMMRLRQVQKVFNKLKVDENARAQDLSVDNWLTLTTTMSKWLN